MSISGKIGDVEQEFNVLISRTRDADEGKVVAAGEKICGEERGDVLLLLNKFSRSCC